MESNESAKTAMATAHPGSMNQVRGELKTQDGEINTFSIANSLNKMVNDFTQIKHMKDG